MSNRFKTLFDASDFQAANKHGLAFQEMLLAAFPEAEVCQNDSQARTDVFEGSPGFGDDCDMWIKWPGLRINFEITGDLRYTLDRSRIFFFNKFSVDKLNSCPDPGFAVYYLAAETPPRFFLRRSLVITDRYQATSTRATARGDTGVKFKIPVRDWMTFEQFVVGVKERLGK